MARNKLSQEMIDNIENYSDQIKTIEDFMEAVRTRPGMYIGPRGAAGFLNMIREVFQNSLDQLVSTKSPCDLVSIIYDERDGGTVTISDNGMGIPFDDMIRVFTKAHTSKNFTKQKGDYSAGLNGIGAKATNALSIEFIATSYKYTGEAKRIEFSKGKVLKESIIDNKEHLNGTSITFKPDQSIMGDTYLETHILYQLIRDILSLTKIGNKVDYTSINSKGVSYHELIVNELGIITNLVAKVDAPVAPPIVIEFDNGDMKLETAFTFDSSNINGERITSFANMCPTSVAPENTHVKGFLDGVVLWFSRYMNNIYLGEKVKNRCIPNDIKAGLSAMVSAWHLDPDFTGQAKEVFSNKDFLPFAKDVILNGLETWSKNSPRELQNICKFIKDCIDARCKAEKEKIKITAKYETSAISGLPEKFRPPTGIPEDLFIVEGDSADGAAVQARNPETQGLYRIRGKILNVYENPDKIASNAEIAGLIAIFGAGYGKSFDISKVKYKKVIFMADADADGAHIDCLLLLVFLKLFPGMIEAGMVYKAAPPLYGIVNGKNKKFFIDRVDYVIYTQDQIYKNHIIKTIDGKNISPSKFRDMLMHTDDYMYNASAIFNRYKISPDLLEYILIAHVKKYSFNTIRKDLVNKYRFLSKEDITQDGDNIEIKGLIDGKIQTLIYNNRFISDCACVLPYIEYAVQNNYTEFIMDDNKYGLYNLLEKINYGSNNVSRFKGLGEMMPEDLEFSTMSKEHRTLIRYTTDDIKKGIETIRVFMSDKYKILKNISAVNRFDLLG